MSNLTERAKTILNDAKESTGEFPPFKTIKDGLGGISRDKVREILRALSAEGFIFKSGPNYSFEKFKATEIKEKKERARKPKTVKDKIKAVPINWANLIVLICLSYIAFWAIRMSVYHSTKFMVEQYNYGYGLAVKTAVMFVLFEIIGIDLGAKFCFKKAKNRLKKTVYVVLGVLLLNSGGICMGLSVWSTIGGIYSERAADLAQNDGERATIEATASKAQREWDSIEKAIERAEKAVETERNKNKDFTERLKTLETGTDQYYSVYYAIINSDKKLIEKEKILNEAMSREAEWLAQGKETSEEAESVTDSQEVDFYRWVGGRVFPGIRADLLEFWLSCLPAILYDTLATLAVAVVLWHLPIRREEEI